MTSSCKRGLNASPGDNDGALALADEGDGQRSPEEGSRKRCKLLSETGSGAACATDASTDATLATAAETLPAPAAVSSEEGGFASFVNKYPFASAVDTTLPKGFSSFTSKNPFAMAAAESSGFGAASSGGFSSFINKNPFEAVSASGGDMGGFASFANKNPFKEAASAAVAAGQSGSGAVGKRAADDSKEACDNDEEGGDNDSDNGQCDSPQDSGADYASTKIFDFESHKQQVVTGEEDETCVMQLRAKLFRLSVDQSAAAAGSSAGGAAASEWVEVGTGPVKVLRRGGEGAARYRVVMRREEKRGGLGTRLILNAPLKEPSTAQRLAGKFFRLSCANTADEPAAGGGPVVASFLFKANQEADVDRLYGEVAAALAAAGGDK